MRGLGASLLGAAGLLTISSGVAAAHPLGNFTINHYAGIRVEPDRIAVDVVIDEAEIPAFQAKQALDANGDGSLDPAEVQAARVPTCVTVAAAMTLTVNGTATPVQLAAAGLSFPPGNGGLSTMRIVCELEAPVAPATSGGTSIVLTDGFEPSRIGWREMTVAGDGVTIEAAGIPAEGATARLTTYPSGLVGAPDTRSVSLHAVPGGPRLAPFTAPDASTMTPIAIAPGVPASLAAPADHAAPGVVPAVGPAVGVGASAAPVPGGDASIPSVLRDDPVTPGLAIAALLAAILLGAGHAVTPGHGKTLMAAYLVGTRGAARDAVGLGVVVAVSHTAGILALALIVLGAATAFAPDIVVRTAPLVAALGVVAVGSWMVAGEIRQWRRTRRGATLVANAHGHGPAPDREHGHEHQPGHDHGRAPDHEHEQPATHHHGRGPFRHSHTAAAGTRVTRRGLFVLGLAGGLVPSANALLILLATVAAGRAAWGVVLVAAFGLGMAAVMTGTGLAVVYAGGLVDRLLVRRPARLAAMVPAVAAVVILGFGLVLTSSALAAASSR